MKKGIHGNVQLICEVDCEGTIKLLRGGDLFLDNNNIGEYCGLSFLEVFNDYPSICKNIKSALNGEESTKIFRLGKRVFELAYFVFYSGGKKVVKVLFIVTLKSKAYELSKENEDIFNRYNNLQKMAKIGNWELNLTTNYLYCSAEIYRIFELDEFRASYESFLECVHPEDREKVDRAYKDSLIIKKPFVLVHRLLMKDGRVKYVKEHCRTKFDKNGKPLLSFCTVQDITEEIQINTIFSKNEEKIRSIIKVAPFGIGVIANGVITEINDYFCRMTGYIKDELLNKDINILFSKEDVGILFEEEQYNQVNAKGVLVVETCIKNKKGDFIDILLSSAPLNQKDFNAGLTFTALDITEKKKAEAVLKRTLNSLEKTVNEKTKELRISEAKYRNLFEQSPEFIAVIDFDGTILEINREHILNELSRDTIIGKNIKDIKIYDKFSFKFDEIINGNIKPFEINVEPKKGVYVWLRVHPAIFEYDNGKFIRLMATEITEQKKISDEIKKMRERLLSIITSANVGTWEWNVDTGEVIFNERWAEIVGYKLEELQMTPINPWNTLCHPEDLEYSNKQLEKHFKGETDFYNIEARMKHKNGNWIWVQDRGKLVTRTKEGNPEWVYGTHTDITLRKRMEEELKKSYFKYKMVADWTYAWEYWVSPYNEVVYMSPSAERITGYKTEEFVENPKLLEEIIFYEDKEKFQKQISKLQNEENNIRHLEFEYRVVTNKGEIRCIHHICRKIFNEEGKYLGLRVSNRDITENKKAIDTISKLSTVIEQSPLAIVITDRNGIIEYANKMTREVTGYDVKELIGKKTSIFKSDETDKKKYAELWHTILEGNIWEGQILNRRKNGELYWEKLILSPILNENNKIINIVAIKEDINKRILLQKELYKYKENLEELVEKRTLQLKQSEKKFKALAENSEDIIVRFNIELNVTYVNKAIESLTGIKKDEWIGKSIVDLKYSKNKLLLWQKTLREVLQNKKVRRLEYDLGNGKWIDWIIIPELMDNGNINSLLVTGRDITSIKEYEINLIDALRREQELNELKSRFISIASHEFRTPLTAILSSSQMLQRFSVKWDNSKLQEHYNRIFESVNNLTELIDEILLIGKAEEGNIELNSCNIEIKEIIEQIIDKLKVSLKSGQIISTEKVNVFNVFTDKKIVEKIITNLLSNAIKYSGEGTKIIIETRKLKNSYVIIVKDEGIGIDEKILDFIFNPFYRADNVMHIHGTGLGLNIVKRFVTLLGGNVSVKSKLNKGTVFEVILPINYISSKNKTR